MANAASAGPPLFNHRPSFSDTILSKFALYQSMVSSSLPVYTQSTGKVIVLSTYGIQYTFCPASYVTVHTCAIRKVVLRAFRCYAAFFAHELALPSSAQSQSDFRASTNMPVTGGCVNCNHYIINTGGSMEGSTPFPPYFKAF